MLRTVSPNISIITNWGCPCNCWYCVWKTHPLKNVSLKTDWNKLNDFLWKNRYKGKVSVSGGGDCLFKFQEYNKWWKILIKICKDYELKLDVHSRNIIKNNKFWKKINRVVISSDKTDDIVDNLIYLFPLTKIRIVHVITKDTTEELIRKYIKLSAEFGTQLTFKELFGFNDGNNYKKFKSIFKGQYFLDAGDYNIYYFPNNTIGNNFMCPPMSNFKSEECRYK